MSLFRTFLLADARTTIMFYKPILFSVVSLNERNQASPFSKDVTILIYFVGGGPRNVNRTTVAACGISVPLS